MSAGWFCCYIPFLILIFISVRRKKEIRQYIKAKIERKNGDTQMQELAKRFIGKDVYMKTIGGDTEDGILTEVTDNAAVLEKNGESRIVNLDYVIRLMEYPKNKKGKRKEIVLD